MKGIVLNHYKDTKKFSELVAQYADRSDPEQTFENMVSCQCRADRHDEFVEYCRVVGRDATGIAFMLFCRDVEGHREQLKNFRENQKSI